MFRFVLRKLLNKKWMVACLLIGNILMIAIAASSPLYSQAILQKTLTGSLSDALKEENLYTTKFYLTSTISRANVTQTAIDSVAVNQELADTLPEKLNIPLCETVQEVYISSAKAYNVSGRTGEDTQQVAVGTRTDFEKNIEVIAGEMYSDTLIDGNTIPVMVSERTMQQQDLLLGDVLDMTTLYMDDSKTETYKIKIVGIFRSNDSDELYWSRSPITLASYCVASPAAFNQVFVKDNTYPFGAICRWNVYLDYTKLKCTDVENIVTTLNAISKEKGDNFEEFVTPYLTSYRSNEGQLNITLLILQTPILVLLCAFIFMVSRQLIELEENEIAVIKSRGSKRSQIVWIYLIQGGILAGVGILLGLPLSFFICKALGASSAFLEFVQRSALPVVMNAKALYYTLAAAGIACLTMVLPALKYSRLSVVSHKVRKQKRNPTPWWQKICLDLILLGVSVYALYSYHNQSATLAQQIANGASLDPLLYFSSSIFIVGAGLLGIRILPWIIQLIFLIGKKYWSPAMYTSFQRVIRTRNSQSFIMLFLVLTISLGIFNAATARSINANNENNLYYNNGADVVLQESWVSASDTDETSGATQTVYSEPAFEVYNEIEGVQSATKVLNDSNARIASESKSIVCQLMGIETKEFGLTAWFKTDLLPQHWYLYLNALAKNANAILVSANLADNYGYAVGDTVKYSDSAGNNYSGVIYGFVEYWPGFNATTTVYADGKYNTAENYLVVSNLAYLQSVAGIRPYQVWMKFTDSTQLIYDYATQTGKRFSYFNDASAQVIELKNDPVFQGTNGMLTTNFIIVLLLCTVGFLIYWVLSIQSRTLQFGIFRAMGMSMREILTMLINEQVLISGCSILIGAVSGVLASKLFVSLIQVAYVTTSQSLPLQTVTFAADYVRLFSVIAGMIILCMVILSMIVSKIKISQALKLGED